jgi:hypothetical protein
MTSDELIVAATDFYLDSGDFNGYSGHRIHHQHGQSYNAIRQLFGELVKDGRGTIVFGDLHPNPHIRAFADETQEKQLQKLISAPLEHACVYPSAKHLSTVIAMADYLDRPFTRELALGAGQLEFRSFDLSVLESYRNDPRYRYTNDDVRGQICVTDEFYQSGQMHGKDQVILETFGFSYDEQMNRAVAAFLRYLNRLTPEHQQTWNSKRLSGRFRLDPDYYRNSILGDWGSGISVFDAFLEELKIVNLMCAAMERPALFRDTFEDNRPRNFSFLVRPTREEFNDFVLTLDKMMSDNINKKFFQDEVPDESEGEREDGKIVVRKRGTVAMLEEWIGSHFRPADPKLMGDMVAALKQVRKLRQDPAHVLRADVFDQKFFHQQRGLVVAAYSAVRTLRLIFGSHPAVKGANIEIPDVLYEGKIWTQ